MEKNQVYPDEQEEGFKKWREARLKINSPRKEGIKADRELYMLDFYEYYVYIAHRFGYDPLPYRKYRKILRLVNRYCAEQLLEGNDLTLPLNLGKIGVVMQKKNPRLTSDGKLIINRSVNWPATLRYWYENPEAEKEKIVIRRERQRIPGLVYMPDEKTHKNFKYVRFMPVRYLARAILAKWNDDTENGYEE